MCEGQKGGSSPDKPIEQPRRRPPSGLLKKQHSAPDLSNPCPNVFDLVNAVQRAQKEDDGSVYSQIEKYEVPEFKIEIPLTPQHTEKKKLNVPQTTGRVAERLPKMYQVPPIFDILVSPKSNEGKYAKQLSQAEQQRIREILHPPMDDDAVSAISMDTRKSRSKQRSSKKKSSRSVSSKRGSGKLKKTASLPSLLGDDDEEEEQDFNRSTSDLTLFPQDKSDKETKKNSSRSRSKTLRKASSDPSLSPRRSSRKRSSSNKKLKKEDSERAAKSKRSSSKTLKKSNSCPSLSGDAEKKKKRRKPKKSGSEEKKRKERRPRSNSTSMLDDPSSYAEAEAFKALVDAEAEALKAEVDYRLRQVQLKLEQDQGTVVTPEPLPQSTPPVTPAQRKTGAHEEERIRVFVESQRRSASLSPSRFRLGDIDGFRSVETNDRRFKSSWSKVQPTPPRGEQKTWSGTNLPPSVSVL